MPQPASCGANFWRSRVGLVFGVDILGIACADCRGVFAMGFDALCGAGSGLYIGIILGGCGGAKLDAKGFCGGAVVMSDWGIWRDRMEP